MRFLLLIFIILLSFLIINRFLRVQKGKIQLDRGSLQISIQRDSTQTPSETVSKSNPFGLMIPTVSISADKKVEIAKELGVTYYRPNDINPVNIECLECEEAKKAGLKLVLTVRNNKGARTPSEPPRDIEEYRNFVSEVLDRYKPFLLVVENEQNSGLFYTGSAEEYLEQLKIACEVAHSKGYKCTDGGLVGSLVILLTADSYEQEGNPSYAEEYLKKALDPKDYSRLINSKNTQIYRKQIEFGRKVLAGYKNAGADYVNFHWYSSSSEAFVEAVNFFKKATGLPALTNEMGQQENVDPSQVTAIMKKVTELNLPVAIWFSADIPLLGQARGLVNPDGTLRENGIAFKNFIQENFK